MSRHIRHCPNCKSRNIEVQAMEMNIAVGQKVACVYCFNCRRRFKVVLDTLRSKKRW